MFWNLLRFRNPASQIARRKRNAEMRQHVLHVEDLESRLVMTAGPVSPADYDALAYILAQQGLSRFMPTFQASQDPLNYDLVPTYTSDWVVTLDPGTSINAVASAVGNVEHIVTFSFEPNTYLLDTSVPLSNVVQFSSQLNSLVKVADSYPTAYIPGLITTQFIPNDTLFPNQFHLQNSGQNGFLPGEDINVVAAWGDTTPNGVTGAGIQVGIVDTGMDTDHEDLAGHYIPGLSFDFLGNDADPNPDPNDGEGSHGTMVAGIAAAIGNNSLGVTGVAWNADIAAIRAVGPGGFDAVTAQAVVFQSDQIDVYNNSWGYFQFVAAPLTHAAIVDAAANGRGGLGTIEVYAGVNSRDQGDRTDYHDLQNMRQVIAVAALDGDGTFASYSDPGAALLVSAYGALDNDSPVGITTTFIAGQGDLNTNYTQFMNGTSAATPQVSGVIALMLQANPTLTFRDVRKILALTARQNDPTNPNWMTNAAGHAINDNYGFGAVNATAAVNLARTWGNLGPEISADSGQINFNTPIPDQGTANVTFTITDKVQIQDVQLNVQIAHNAGRQLEIVLTSPSGTQTVFAVPQENFDTDFSNWTFSTPRLLDELSPGTWTLSVRDTVTGESGTLQSARLQIFGTNPIVASTLLIAPTQQTHAVGGTASFVVTALDQNGDPIRNLPIQFTVIGANPQTFSRLTDVNGQVFASYVGNNAGTDIVLVSSGNVTAQASAIWLQSASLSGFVYVDSNNNGLFDQGEVPIPGVTVTLTGSDTFGGTADQTAITDATGAYFFGSLLPGIYTINEDQPPAYVDGIDTVGSLGGTVFNDAFTDIIVTEGDIGTGYNFGELGLRPEFLSKRFFFSSSTNAAIPGNIANPQDLANFFLVQDEVRYPARIINVAKSMQLVMPTMNAKQVVTSGPTGADEPAKTKKADATFDSPLLDSKIEDSVLTESRYRSTVQDDSLNG